ncbi:hypothetical protein [Streptomyces sp. 8L]|uniref:hypothetical protein n=1 Tax=Streptomyces sp. 8L TaxID=2877242 RepID=UPI0035A89BB5
MRGRTAVAMGRMWRGPRGTWTRRIAVVVAACVVLPVVTAGAALRLTYTGDLKDGTRTRGRDAVWMGHAWLDGRKDDADLAAFARRVEGTGIKDLYVHAGPLEHDGTLPAGRYARAGWLIAAVHRSMPGVRVHAWLGDVLATEGPDGLRLSRAATREAVLGAARQVLDAGFDGVHFDLEPLHSGDRDFLLLLDDVHALTRGRGATLSVAAAQIDPLPSLHTAAGALTDHPKWWSQAYFRQVARRVDQIAVMSYDTAMPLQSLYGGYVAHQTSLALAATPAGTDLLMGLPFYREEDMSHHGYAETPAAAIHGLRLALGRDDAHRERFGVALYVDFAATAGDWKAYRDGWGATSRA